MQKCAVNLYNIRGPIWIVVLLGLFVFSACRQQDNSQADKLNESSYSFHYRNLDSTEVMARKALQLSQHTNYASGIAEAYNNIIFVKLAKMQYAEAYCLLDSVYDVTDNQVELLIADIQGMRLCQRESKNKNFYDYRQKALERLNRIAEESATLSPHLRKRLLYAQTEFSIVSSTYYYYVGLKQQSVDALNHVCNFMDIDADNLLDDMPLRSDMSQYINMLYQIGEGGILTGKDRYDIARKEFAYLFKCYVLATQYGLVYWQANALQALSEHLIHKEQRSRLIDSNKLGISYINSDNMPDSLLAGNLAQRSLNIFQDYGDVYQTAGAYRSLSLCYWELGDYRSALICLEKALNVNENIKQAPDLVASISEHLSLVYSAMDDKYNSDINRNIYLDLQEVTRQDRTLEARAEQLERLSMQLNALIIAILALIIITILLLVIFRRMARRTDRAEYIDRLLQPLKTWEENNLLKMEQQREKTDDINEQLALARLQTERYKRQNIDNKAKFFLVSNVIPYIDRMINEVRRIRQTPHDGKLNAERFGYVVELTRHINDYNQVLTQWIQLQRGQLDLHIESFPVQDVFDIIARSQAAFRLQGITLHIMPTPAVVKADKTLTLFMLNTLADNARKFTPQGGKVTVGAKASCDAVEIYVEDTGKGIPEEQLATIFTHQVSNGHGFGLMNCKGIIERYRKASSIFSVCRICAHSKVGEGSRFSFRLPLGVLRLVLALVSLMAPLAQGMAGDTHLRMADLYADSAYFCNVNGEYRKTIAFSDSVIHYLNRHYLTCYPSKVDTMTLRANGRAMTAEIGWFRRQVKTDYGLILDIRNEVAVAALALHDWTLYNDNNQVYVQLFKLRSADRSLPDYCITMQRSSADKVIAVLMLSLLLLTIVLAYYFMYYRRRLYFRFCAEQIEGINKVLLADDDNQRKYQKVEAVDTSKYPQALADVVKQIAQALRRSVALDQRQQTDIELLEDELHREQYEAAQLYVANSITDNCLSALKHETMYYPSRIQQLVETDHRQIDDVNEVVSYYKELYTILTEQTRQQVTAVKSSCRPVSLKHVLHAEVWATGDAILLDYLFEILRRQCGAWSGVDTSMKENKYLVVCLHFPDFNTTPQQAASLFSPSVDNIPFLVCKQIIRDNSEQTNLHGCGIVAAPHDGGGTQITITLAGVVNRNDNIYGGRS